MSNKNKEPKASVESGSDNQSTTNSYPHGGVYDLDELSVLGEAAVNAANVVGSGMHMGTATETETSILVAVTPDVQGYLQDQARTIARILYEAENRWQERFDQADSSPNEGIS